MTSISPKADILKIYAEVAIRRQKCNLAFRHNINLKDLVPTGGTIAMDVESEHCKHVAL